ncbi:MAG: hypothetical protein R3330_13700, partial [Saprospiraceae bacterium]|nr:hypothetical protein [Saprospiraceae bacterium]
MIYYATVHWMTDRWIEIQDEMLKRYTGAPYRVFAFLNGISEEHHARFDVIEDEPIRPHDLKLDRLAMRIAEVGQDDDWLIFIDGDAFPLKPVRDTLGPLLETYPLVAVQRPENLGECQPHPCFCATTIGFWKRIGGTWAKGYTWINAMGNPDTDVGGELLGILERTGTRWLPLLRSNTVDLHPVFFGLYANFIYHHGSGFRQGASRQGYYEAGLYEIYKRLDARILNNLVPRKYLTQMRNSLVHPEGRRKRRIYKAMEPIEREIFAQIKTDPESVWRLGSPDEHQFTHLP